MKMKNVAIVLIVLSACNTPKPEAVSVEFNDLKAEVITIHDEAMAEMGTIMRLKKELVAELDSTAIDSTAVVAIEDLEAAHEGMMVWMRGFSDAFTGEELLNGLPEQFDTEEAKAEAEQKLDALKAQEASVKKMNEMIKNSISQAKATLQGK
ncbi:hypothetical protein [Reichenbachiella agariperforans]|uniref:hypothetical protein n=1 Tax=Reichenbachiella agariperforans TaxID=156994 RepID=UPI001C0A0F7A|nr:hypothetical protein [Reichenbachiella agariperforans]MBU2916129.1 hypothetical protein [Reichenbachiella agariperforans]